MQQPDIMTCEFGNSCSTHYLAWFESFYTISFQYMILLKFGFFDLFSTEQWSYPQNPIDLGVLAILAARFYIFIGSAPSPQNLRNFWWWIYLLLLVKFLPLNFSQSLNECERWWDMLQPEIMTCEFGNSCFTHYLVWFESFYSVSAQWYSLNLVFSISFPRNSDFTSKF